MTNSLRREIKKVSSFKYAYNDSIWKYCIASLNTNSLMKKIFYFFFLDISLLVFNCSAQFEAPLDTTFSGVGYWMEYHSNSLPASTTVNSITSIALQPDGKILAAGPAIDSASSDYFTVRRFNPDGSYDTSFGINGKSEPASFNYIPTEKTFAHQVAVYDDGRIVVEGVSRYSGDQNWKYVLTRYTPNGMLDTTFGTGGKTSFFALCDWIPYPPISIAVQDDGKILELTSMMYRLTRLETDGSLDSVIFFLSSYQFHPSKVLVDSIGKIYVAGGDTSGAQVYRMNPDLSMDVSFGINGKTEYPFPDLDFESKDMVIQADGKIITTGLVYASYNNIAYPVYLRFNTDGSPDSTFGLVGDVHFVEDSDFAVQAMTLQADGKILITGQKDSDIYIKRLLTNGIPDASLNTGGMMKIIPPAQSIYFPGQFDKLYPNDILVQPDNKIVIGGYGLYSDTSGNYWDWYLVRLNSNLTIGIDDLETKDKFTLRIFPNPFQQAATVNLANEEGHLIHIKITDISGRLVESFFTRENLATLNKEDKKPGMYFISAFDETGSHTSFGKLIIE